MSEGSGEKTYTIKDIEIERGHAQKFQEEVETLKKQLKSFEGINLDEIVKIKKEHAELKNKAAVGDESKIQERINEAVKEVETRLTTALETERKQTTTLAEELKRERVTKEIIQKAGSLCTPDGLKLLTPIFEREGDWVDGKPVFKDKDGKIRYSPKDATKPLSHDEFLEGLKTEYPSAFLATSKAGGKDGVMKINGSGGSVTSLKDLKHLPDGGKSYLNELGKTDPKALRSLIANSTN